jgi:hypothetical protein
LTVGRFRFSRVVIPSGVTVRFRGFDVAVIESQGDMEINGTIDVSGTNGTAGVIGGGGNGGNGGGTSGGAPVGGSAGLGGNAWHIGSCEGPSQAGGEPGQIGQGPFDSPGRPTEEFLFPDPITGGGSGAGGGNGTRGADGQGHTFFIVDDITGPPRAAKAEFCCGSVAFRSLGGPAFGQAAFSIDSIEPAGGGDGGDGPGGCDTGEHAGGGGGGGGGAGAIVLQAQGTIRINAGGEVLANGGNGGDGHSDTFSGGGGGGAGGFIRIQCEDLEMNGGRLEAFGGRGGQGQNGAFDGGGGGGGRIHITASCSEGSNQGQSLMAVPGQAGCPVPDVDGDAPLGSTGGGPTVVLQQNAKLELEQTEADYLPEDGNTLTFKAELKPKGTKAKITFELFEISRFYGATMNTDATSGPNDGPDYDFGVSQNKFDPPVTLGSGATTVIRITSRDEEKSITVKVFSHDYGGIGQLRAKATVNGQEVQATVKGTADQVARIPLDDDQNGLPDDGWKAGRTRVRSQGLMKTDDDDMTPTGNGTAGDGLTVFEEYRGFMADGKHRRTDPEKKDLFILSELQNLPEDAGIEDADHLPLEVHELKRGEINVNTRLINPNKANSGFGGTIVNSVDQQALHVKDGGYIRQGLIGDSFVVGPPVGRTRAIEVYVQAIREASPTHNDRTTKDSFDKDAIKKNQGHEVGHGISITHYTYVPGGDLSVMASEYFVQTTDRHNDRWNNIPHNYLDPGDTGEIRLR